jgi:hypothetical protein
VRAMYKCQRCRRPITRASVFAWAEWIERHADRLEAERLDRIRGTRKQTLVESDRDISAVGIGAELAACVILAPWALDTWKKSAEECQGNRGADLPGHFFHDGRPVEIKFTAHRGHLLVRPPRNTPGPMLPEYIEDSIYVLMTGERYTYEAVGWAGRSDLLRRGRLNPVPVKPGRRECWGIHADDLNPTDSLLNVLYRSRTRRGPFSRQRE